MSKAILAIEFEECSKIHQEFCLYNKKYKGCKDAILKCHYPITRNPLCLSKSFDECPKFYDIVDYKGRKFIVYRCNKCDNFIGNIEDAIRTILEPKEDKKIYYGKDLDKLLKSMKYKIKPLTDVELLIEFFDKIFKVTNTRA